MEVDEALLLLAVPGEPEVNESGYDIHDLYTKKPPLSRVLCEGANSKFLMTDQGLDASGTERYNLLSFNGSSRVTRLIKF